MVDLPGAAYLRQINGGGTATPSPSTTPASGGTPVVSVAPIGDGNSHPLSERYSTLALAQADFYFVNSLSQQIDWAIIQKGLIDLAKTGGKLKLPRGKFILGRASPYVSFSLQTVSDNIWIEGEGVGQTILCQETADTCLLFADGTNKPFKNFSIRGVSFEGCDPLSRDFNDPSSIRSGLVAIIGKSELLPIQNVSISECSFRNPIRHGLILGYCARVRVENSSWSYYDDASLDTHFQVPGNIGRVGIFAGIQSVVDFIAIGNSFNGNSFGTEDTQTGADGFIWIGKGGDISISSNSILNYKLEGIQLNAGPAVVEANVFDTKIGREGAIALLSYPDTSNSDPTKGPFSFDANFSFIGNTVKGGAGGCHFKGFTNPVPAPRLKGIISNNSFQLKSSILDNIAVAISSADEAIVSNNDAKGFGSFFVGLSSIDDPSYRNGIITISNNTTLLGSSDCIKIISAMANKVIIKDNVLSAPANHAHVLTTYNIKAILDGNIFTDDNGSEISPFIALGAGSSAYSSFSIGRKIFPEIPIAGASVGDIALFPHPGPNLPFAAIYSSVNSKGTSFDPIFSARNGVVGSVSILASSCDVPSILLPKLDGKAIRVIGVKAIVCSTNTWIGNFKKLIIRSNGSSSFKIAEIPIDKFNHGKIFLDESNFNLIQSSDGIGGFGGVHPYGAGIEVVATTDDDIPARGTSGGVIQILVSALFE